jgi:hypothetical protein
MFHQMSVSNYDSRKIFSQLDFIFRGSNINILPENDTCQENFKVWFDGQELSLNLGD